MATPVFGVFGSDSLDAPYSSREYYEKLKYEQEREYYEKLKYEQERQNLLSQLATQQSKGFQSAMGQTMGQATAAKQQSQAKYPVVLPSRKVLLLLPKKGR